MDQIVAVARQEVGPRRIDRDVAEAEVDAVVLVAGVLLVLVEAAEVTGGERESEGTQSGK